MPRQPRPFSWQSLPVADRRHVAVADAIASWAGTRPTRAEIATPSGPLRVRAGRAELLGGLELRRALGDPTSAVAIVRSRGARPVGYVVAGGALIRALAHVILGGPGELDGPRAPTPAERGVLAYAVAAALSTITPSPGALVAEPTESAGPLLAAELGEAAVLELDLDGPCAGWAVVVVPMGMLTAPPRRLPLRALLAGEGRGQGAAPGTAGRRLGPPGPWIDEPAIEAPVALGSAYLPRARATALAVRDVLVTSAPFPPRTATLRIGKGAIACALAPTRDGLIVSGDYARGAMSETLGDDATVEIVACAGAVSLSVRGLLELVPGQVLGLGTPLGGPVELRVGRQVVGRGELVDVDGELGVRVLEVERGVAR